MRRGLPSLRSVMRMRQGRFGGLSWIRAAAAAMSLLVLLAVVGTLARVGAQQELADDDAIPVYVLARVHSLTTGDARGSYLIEFGVLPVSTVAAAGGSAAAAAAANVRFLPERRYLTEAKIIEQARAQDRRWLRSSPIRIPVGGGVSPRVLEGRVIARWNPNPDGLLRVEFGFLPGRALTAAGDTQAAARLHAVLPTSRYMSATAIARALSRSSPRWTRSTPVDAPTRDIPPPLQTPRIAWAGYTPGTVEFGGAAPRLSRPTATVNGQAVSLQYRYSVDPRSAEICTVRDDGALTVLGVGGCSVRADSVATARYDSATASASVRVAPGDPRPMWDGYSAATARLGDDPPLPRSPSAADNSIRFRFESLTPGVCRADPRRGALTLVAVGLCTVRLSTEAHQNYRAASVESSVTIEEKPPEQVTPDVAWSGYESRTATVGEPGKLPEPPRATVSGAQVNVLFKYRTASAGVCRVDENIGLLTPLSKGNCVVTATSVATARYLPATAMATVSIVTKEIKVDRVTCTPLSPRAGEDVSCSAVVSDGTPLGYAWAGHASLPGGGLGALEGVGNDATFTTRFTTSGPKIVRVTVWDASATAEGQTTVIVEPGNVPPKIESATCSPTEPFVSDPVTCSVTISQGSPPITYNWQVVGGDPARGSEATFKTSLALRGPHTIQVTARNSFGADAKSVAVVAKPVPPPEGAPVCDAVSPLRMTTNDYETEIDLVDVCSDPEGEDLTFNVTANPSGIVRIFDPRGRGRQKTTLVDWEDLGTATVTVTATDPGGLSGSTSFRVTVTQGTECRIVPDIFTDLRKSAGRTYEYDLNDYCEGPNLRFGNLEVTSSFPRGAGPRDVVMATLSGSRLTVTVRGFGVATVDVTATGSDRETSHARFDVVVNR